MRVNPYTVPYTSAYGVSQNKKESLANKKTPSQEQTKTDNVAVEASKFEHATISEYKAALKISGKATDEEINRRIAYRDSLRGVEIQHQERAINPERLAEDKARAAKYAPIQAKMLSGQTLTAEEKDFLRKYYPAAYKSI